MTASRRVREENRAAYLFLLPWFAGFFCITAGPLVASLFLSFTRYDMLEPPRWIGLGRDHTGRAGSTRYDLPRSFAGLFER